MAAPAILLAAVLAGEVLAGSPDASANQIAEMRDMTTGGRLAPLSDSNFDNLVRLPNRPYHTFVLFTAKEPVYHCQLCGPFENEIAVLADSLYRQQVSGQNTTQIFFARADISSCRLTFAEYSLQQAPLLVYFGPTGAGPHSKTKLPANSQYASELDADNAMVFVQEKTNFRIEIYRSPWPRIISAVVLLCALAAVIILAGERLVELFENIRGYTLLWFVAGVSIYYISVSGVLYDIIRGVPPFGYDQRTRRAVFIANQAGTQYGIEGLIIGALNSAAAFCVILMARFLPKIRNAEMRNYATIAAAVTFLFLFYQVYSLYNYKNSWYSLWMLIRG